MASNFLDSLVYEEVTSNERLMEIAAAYCNDTIVYLDMETSGLDVFVDRPWITSLYFGDGPVYNVNMWFVELNCIKEFLETRIICGAELKFDLKWLRREGIRPRRVQDVIIHSRIRNTGYKLPNSLAVLTEKYLDVKLHKELRMRWVMDPREVAVLKTCPDWGDEMHRYAASDVYVLPPILAQQRKELEKEGLIPAAQLENMLVPVVADMEYDGVLVDPVRWMEIVNVAKVEMDALKKTLATQLVGKRVQESLFNNPLDLINLDSQPAVIAAFDKLGIKLDNLAKLTIASSKYELPKLYSKYKEYAKQVQTYGESWIAHIHKVTGRVHSSFLQLSDQKEKGESEGQEGGTDTARFSSRGPNVQNVPHNPCNKYPIWHSYWTSKEAIEKNLKYDPKLPDWNYRDCFVASPGYKLATVDLSQAEVRILADISKDPKLIADIASGIDIHTAVSASMFKKKPEDITKEERTKGKTLNFAVIYGLGAESLAMRLELINKYDSQLKVTYPKMKTEARENKAVALAKEEAQGLIDAYFKTYVGVKAWISWAQQQPMGVGYTKTVIGRRRYFSPIPEEAMLDKDLMRKYTGGMQRQGSNSVVQGTCADMTKKAMVSVASYIFQNNIDARMVNSVHDEIVVEVREDIADEVLEQVKKRMIAAANSMLSVVKMDADGKVSDKWEK